MLYIGFWLLCAAGAAVIGSARGESGPKWALVGAALGPVGVVLATTAGRRCPSCRSRIHKDATICPKCQTASDPPPVATTAPQAPPESEAPDAWARNVPWVWILVGVALLLGLSVGLREDKPVPPAAIELRR